MSKKQNWQYHGEYLARMEKEKRDRKECVKLRPWLPVWYLLAVLISLAMPIVLFGIPLIVLIWVAMIMSLEDCPETAGTVVVALVLLLEMCVGVYVWLHIWGWTLN